MSKLTVSANETYKSLCVASASSTMRQAAYIPQGGRRFLAVPMRRWQVASLSDSQERHNPVLQPPKKRSASRYVGHQKHKERRCAGRGLRSSACDVRDLALASWDEHRWSFLAGHCPGNSQGALFLNSFFQSPAHSECSPEAKC